MLGLPRDWNRNQVVIYSAALLRTTGVGMTGVLVAVYASRLGLSLVQIGVLITAGMAANAAATVFVSLYADRFGRRPTLILLALLGAVGGAGLALTHQPSLLVFVSFIGLVNGSGTDRGPCFVLEQAILPQTTSVLHRTRVLSWHTIVMDIGHAAGALLAGLPILVSRWSGLDLFASYRATFAFYAALNVASALLYAQPGVAIEVQGRNVLEGKRPPLAPKSKAIVTRLSALFAVDSFGGGFMTDALIAYWFFRRFGISEDRLGLLFAIGNVLNSFSYLGAAKLASRIGLLNTMVFTHIPSSVLLMLIPIAPSPGWAVAFFLAWESLVEMDVPTRQSYLMAVVEPEDRTFSTGMTNLSRSVARAVSPTVAGYMMQQISLAAPLFFGGGLKILYDIVLYRAFRHLKPPEEEHRGPR